MILNKKSVLVVPLGEISDIVLNIVCEQITRCFKLKTQILPPLEQPEHAFDERRLQYNAGIIIKSLEFMHSGNPDKVIGIMSQDLFIPVFTHVFGEARQGGTCALVSLSRLAKNPDGSAPNRSLIHERAAKVALHELGHLFDLLHCEYKQCLMHFSGGIEELDEMSYGFCEYCSIYLKDALQ